VLVTVLTALGVEQIIAFEKRYVNYRFTAHGRDLLTTVVTVPEPAERTFIELETITDHGDVDAAVDVAQSVLRELGIEDSGLTTQAYTDAVATRRSQIPGGDRLQPAGPSTRWPPGRRGLGERAGRGHRPLALAFRPGARVVGVLIVGGAPELG